MDFFEAEGLKARHWTQVGKQGVPDKEIFKYAREGSHVIVTQDLDFGRLLAEHKSGLPTVIQIRVNIPTPEKADRFCWMQSGLILKNVPFKIYNIQWFERKACTLTQVQTHSRELAFIRG